jgi:hypothetical protein
MGDVARDGTGRFMKGGPSPNPGGRPRGLAQACREIADPDLLIRTLLSIATDPTARNADRIRAAAEILDRGWGRPPAFAPIEGGDPLEQSEIDRAILGLVEQLRERATTAPQDN